MKKALWEFIEEKRVRMSPCGNLAINQGDTIFIDVPDLRGFDFVIRGVRRDEGHVDYSLSDEIMLRSAPGFGCYFCIKQTKEEAELYTRMVRSDVYSMTHGEEGELVKVEDAGLWLGRKVPLHRIFLT